MATFNTTANVNVSLVHEELHEDRSPRQSVGKAGQNTTHSVGDRPLTPARRNVPVRNWLFICDIWWQSDPKAAVMETEAPAQLHRLPVSVSASTARA